MFCFKLLIKLFGCVVFFAGCTAYEPRPLDLRERQKDWIAQSLDAETVCAYADQLAKPAGEAGRLYDPSDGLSLREAEAVALHFNADLRLCRARAEVPLASAREAGWWDDPAFEAEVLRYASRGSSDGWRMEGPSVDGVGSDGLESTGPGYRRTEGDYVDTPWVVGASLSFTIPLSGRLATEKDWAWAQYNAAWRQVLIDEWELIGDLHQTWLEWSACREKIVLVEEYLSRSTEVARQADRLAKAGELQAIEARVLQVELARQRSDLFRLQFRERGLRLELHALLGFAPEAEIQLVPDITVGKEGESFASRREQLIDHHPRIQFARAEYESAEHQLRHEIRRQYPDLDIGPSYSWEEGFSRLGFGFGMPVPLWNRNRRAIAEAAANRETCRVSAEAVMRNVMSDLAEEEARLDAARRSRTMLAGEVAPLVDQQLTETRQLLQMGEIDVLVLRDALSASLQTKMDIVDATLAEALSSHALRNMLQPVWVSRSQEDEETKK